MITLGDGYKCPAYDITKQPVSLHRPFHRFLIELVGRFSLSTSAPLSQLLRAPLHIIGLIDDLLRANAFVHHIRAGLWVLNGSMLMQQAATYERIQARESLFEPDLLAMQISAVVMPSNVFLSMLAYRYMVHNLVLPVPISADPIGDDVDKAKIGAIVESFIATIVSIVTERSRITPDSHWGLRRDIVHWLMVSDLTHSDLLYRLGLDAPSDDVRDVLADVARYVTPSHMESAKYHIKKEVVVGSFDPFYAKYTDAQRESALTHFAEQGHQQASLPSLPILSPPFLPLFNLLSSQDLYRMIQKVYIRNQPKLADWFPQIMGNSELLTSKMLLSCLRLIGAGLRDAQNHPSFSVADFIENLTVSNGAQDSVFEMLCKLIRDVREIKPVSRISNFF